MNMKQKALLCIFICVVGILSGCSKAENNVINTSDKCAQAGYFENNCRLAEGESGDYIMDIIYPYAISFIEEGQDKRIYLCGKPDCEHQDGRSGVLTTCNSYVGEIILSSLVFYDDWLYMLSYDENYIYLSNYRSYNFYEDTSIERSITILNMNGEQEGLISLEEYKGRPLCVTEDRIYVEIIEPEEGRLFVL